MDAQGDRMAGIWHGAGKLITRGIARAGGDGAPAGRGPGLRVYHRRAARAALRGEAGTGHAGPQDRLPGARVSQPRGAREDFRKDVGPFSLAETILANGDAVCATDLRPGRCGPRNAGCETRGNAERARARAGYCGKVVFTE